MVPLIAMSDYVTMLILAGAFGSLGGIAFELLQVRQAAAAVAAAPAPAAGVTAETGAIQLPHPLTGKERLYDLGVLASLFIGGVAAISALYFFPPQVTIQVTGADGSVKTLTQYDVVKLVALALIVGSAGPSLLTSMQSRVQAALSERKAEATQALSKQQLEEVKSGAKDELKKAVEAALQGQMGGLLEPIRRAAEASPQTAETTTEETSSAVMSLITDLTDSATRQFEENIDRRIAEAQKTIAAA